MNYNLRKTLILQLLYHGSVFIYSFWIVASSILIVLVIILENDIFKLYFYLNIYFFLV